MPFCMDTEPRYTTGILLQLTIKSLFLFYFTAYEVNYFNWMVFRIIIIIIICHKFQV
jgi:hypothetical protein